MNRYKASSAHLGISIVIAGIVYIAVRYLWYPGALFDVAGGLQLLVLIIVVDVILGPLITLIVFKPGKPGLKFDLAFIGVVQLTALAYGLWSIAESRPVFLTFVKDRFELVRAGELEEADLAAAAPGFGSLPWFGYRLAGARLPRDPKEQLKYMDLGVVGGKDLHYFPKLYVDYSAVAGEAARASGPLAELRKLNPGREGEVEAVVRRAGPEEALGFLPMRAGKSDLTVIVKKPTGEVEALLALRPWEY